jgi:effector-binding domain-containing protein
MFVVEVRRASAQRYMTSPWYTANGAPVAPPRNEESTGPVEIGVPRADGEHEVPAGELAVTVVEGEQCEFPHILGAYDAITRWATEHGRELECPPREVYLNADHEPPRIQIAWPLR